MVEEYYGFFPPDGVEDFGFPPEILSQVVVEREPGADPFAYVPDHTPEEDWYNLSTIGDLATAAYRAPAEEVARIVAAGFRGECLTVRLPGIPGGEYIAEAADWWGQQAVDFFGGPVTAVGAVNDSINQTVQDALGIPGGPGTQMDSRPRATAGMGPGPDGFLVKLPGWQDIITYNNDSLLNERSKQQLAAEYSEILLRSPTPPSLQDVGKLLTVLDDVQDEAATLAILLMIAEKIAGRAIPGVGQVVMVADALQLIYALSNVATGSGLPGRKGKRRAHEKGKQTRNGMRGKLDDFRRTGSLKIGVGDILQGLQATDSMFGTGIQLGGIMGFLQDAFWGGIRGAEFEARGPAWDPLGFTEAGRNACYRSPSLDQVHPKAYFALANDALSVWSKASRILPYIDLLGEHALAGVLMGLRNSEMVLGPWLRSGVWVDPLIRALEIIPTVNGGVEAHDTKDLKPDQWLKRTVPATKAAVSRAIANVAHRDRQGFYDSLVASIGWGFMGDLEPGAKVLDMQLGGPAKDAVLLLDAGRIPRFDLED